jgi:PPOX class probable F420-dependent enzyme
VTLSARPDDTLQIDETTSLGARAAHHLRDAFVVWLTTVSPTGAPAPNPVWFLWDGSCRVLVFSNPGAYRVRHLATNPRVSLSFPADPAGRDVVILSGIAGPQPGSPPADRTPAFLAKYADRIAGLGLTPATFAEHHAMPIRITLTGMRGPTRLPTAGTGPTPDSAQPHVKGEAPA